MEQTWGVSGRQKRRLRKRIAEEIVESELKRKKRIDVSLSTAEEGSGASGQSNPEGSPNDEPSAYARKPGTDSSAENEVDLCGDNDSTSCSSINSCNDGSSSDTVSDSLDSDVDTDRSVHDSDEDTDLDTDCSVHEKEELFSGSATSTHECSLMLLSIFNKHSISYSCVSDILKLFSQVLPVPNSLPRTHTTILKQFIDVEKYTTLHRCCGFCTRLLDSDSCCSRTECQLSSASNSFIEVRLDRQLQNLFSGMLETYYT